MEHPFGGLLQIVILAFLSQMFGRVWTSTTNEFRSTYFNVTKQAKLALTDVYQHIEQVSHIECSNRCSTTQHKCQSLNYQSATRKCELSTVPAVQLPISKVPAVGWSVAGKLNVWTLIFRGTPGIGKDVYTAWTSGQDVTTDDVECKKLITSNCTQHFRDPMVSSWTALSISKVKYSMYKDGDEVAYITFNATGSDINNWFSKDRILQSSWIDLEDQGSFQYFSIEGDPSTRRFFIHRAYGSCAIDTGYTVAITDSSSHNCPMDNLGPYPQFYYANSQSWVLTNLEDPTLFPRADVMAIHVMT